MPKQYHDALKKILGEGSVQYEPRTQEYILGISAFQFDYNLKDGFLIETTKRVFPRLGFEELFWKLRGERGVKTLVERNVNYWNANAFDRHLRENNLRDKFPKHTLEWNEEFVKFDQRLKNDSEFAEVAGDLGPVYGFNWRNEIDEKTGKNIDQLKRVINGIKNKPGSRYHVLNAWNVSRLSDMALGPCPFWHQFSVWGDSLDLTVVQRSNDTYLGIPYNQIQDGLFLEMMAKETGLEARFLHHQTINTHVYLGVPGRSNFWTDEKNVEEFQRKFNEIENKEEYLSLKDWYLESAPSESEGNEKKDHIPFILEQLSKEHKPLPTLIFKEEVPIMEAMHMPPMDLFGLEGYEYHKWPARAAMAS
ncbi:MAG: thymidylate synthase [Nanoarchaeota archaeon]|nr:thymidylate synthase [Nanoarchaeota archaeon]